MADSTVLDISHMKVTELRKELKLRGLPYAGDKAELIARLTNALAAEPEDDVNLDSDEIDSDGMLEDGDDKGHADITLDETAEDLALADVPLTKQPEEKPQKPSKRKLTTSVSVEEKHNAIKETGSKKIILNRNTSVTAISESTPDNNMDTTKTDEEVNESNLTVTGKVKVTVDMDQKSRLEMRAKRFGLPVNMSDQQRKEARKQRFGSSGTAISTSNTISTGSLPENLDKLKQRAERFGQNVSKIMSDIDAKEKIEKRKAKFGLVK